MADHVFGISTSNLCLPMFGDARMSKKTSDDWKTRPLYTFLTKVAKDFDDSNFSDLADLKTHSIPARLVWDYMHPIVPHQR